MMTLILMIAGFTATLVAGVFLSFSDFVMRGLSRAPDAQGALGMVGLTRTVYRSVFMVMLLGLVPSAIVLAIVAFWQLQDAARAITVVGSAAYLMGVVAVTALGNVPMNTRLDQVSERSRAITEYWPAYVRGWTYLNHVRTASALTTGACWMTAASLN